MPKGIHVDGVKKCCICKIWYPRSSFHKSKCRWDGLNTYCKSCNNIKFRKYYQANKERCRAISYKSVDKHRARQNARQLAIFTFPDRQTCSIKGCDELGHRHHEDYEKAKEIIWLCRKHHAELHAMMT